MTRDARRPDNSAYFDLDCDDGEPGAELRHGEGEDEPLWPLDLQIFAGMPNVAHFRAAFGEHVAASDARIDDGLNRLAIGRREQEMARDARVEEGVEHPFRRRREGAPDDDIYGPGHSAQASVPWQCLY